MIKYHDQKQIMEERIYFDMIPKEKSNWWRRHGNRQPEQEAGWSHLNVKHEAENKLELWLAYELPKLTPNWYTFLSAPPVLFHWRPT